MGYEYGLPVGLKDVYFATLKKDDETGAVYDTPFKIGDAITVKPSFEFSEGRLDADDKTIRDDAELIGIKLQINVARLSPETQAKLLGRRIDANGGMIMKDGDVAPEGALLYRTTLDNNRSKFACIYKGVFKDFAEEASTKKKGSKDYSTPTLDYTAYRRSDGLLRYDISEETEGYSEAVTEQWFKKVPEPADGDLTM